MWFGLHGELAGNLSERLVEGRYVTDILLDTGCSRTLVLQELVPPGMHVKNIAC